MKRAGLKNAAEIETIYARDQYCYLAKAGVAAGIKRQIRRRERHEARREIRQTPV